MPEEPPSIEAYIASESLKFGLGEDFRATLLCESNLNPAAVGDHGTSFGIAQIHLPAHPDISQEEALDPYFSIHWAAEEFSKGHESQWTCYRIIKMHAIP